MESLRTATVFFSIAGADRSVPRILFEGSIDEAMSFVWDQPETDLPYLYIRVGDQMLGPDDIAALKGA